MSNIRVRYKYLPLLTMLFVCVSVLSLAGCKKETDKKNSAPPPAKVENPIKESQLSSITLSLEAEKRLGIETAVVEHRKLSRASKLGGEIVAIPGRQAIVSAPYAGKVISPATPMQAGSRIIKGQEIFRLLLLPGDKDVIGARSEVEVKRAQFELAQSKAQRAEQLLKEKAASQKAVEELRSELVAAEAAYNAALARLKLLDGDATNSQTSGLSTMVLTSPITGVLQKIHVSAGQTVAASTPVFEVSSNDPLWVRVPVYVGDVAKIQPQSSAQVQPLGGSELPARAASPVQGPTLSDPTSASSDLFFEMENRDGRFRVGERVNVTLAQTSEEEGLIVPSSAILYDVDGGTWVYVNTEPQIYQRRRVEVQHMLGDQALLARGPEPGAKVVIAGAAELFGTEFGAGK